MRKLSDHKIDIVFIARLFPFIFMTVKTKCSYTLKDSENHAIDPETKIALTIFSDAFSWSNILEIGYQSEDKAITLLQIYGSLRVP